MNILDTILTNTYTIQDLHHRVRILKSQLENKLFGQSQTNEFSPDDSGWLSSMPPLFIKEFTKDNFYSSFNELEDQIKKLKPLVIYLGFEPKQQQIESIGEWLKNNLNQTKLFEIKIDPSLLGGVALVNGGVYRDYSLRTRIQEQSQTILAEFKKYIR